MILSVEITQLKCLSFGFFFLQVTDTNDNPPAFLENAYSFDIPEDAPRGYRVGVVRAEDADVGSNSQLTYTVISDWANDVFSLNPQTGVFTLTARLDYEEVSICIFQHSKMAARLISEFPPNIMPS